jgi:hypothetical protein
MMHAKLLSWTNSNPSLYMIVVEDGYNVRFWHDLW